MLNFIASWRREREAIRELTRLSDRELDDLGIARADIRAIATCASTDFGSRNDRETMATMAPSWGSHVARSAAA